MWVFTTTKPRLVIVISGCFRVYEWPTKSIKNEVLSQWRSHYIYIYMYIYIYIYLVSYGESLLFYMYNHLTEFTFQIINVASSESSHLIRHKINELLVHLLDIVLSDNYFILKTYILISLLLYLLLSSEYDISFVMKCWDIN